MIHDLFQALEIERQDQLLANEGVSVDLYFDTFDVQRALLGMLDYIERRGGPDMCVNFKDFETDNALVAALLDSGILGAFRVLPPHQAELRRHLEHDDAFTNPANSAAARGIDFLDELGLLRPANSTPKHVALNGLSTEKLEDLVRAHSNNAPKLFKALQCVRDPWWKRLERWERENLLELDSQGFDAQSLTAHPQFSNVIEAFREVRETTTNTSKSGVRDTMRRQKQGATYNDFADAMALIGIVTLVEDYETGRRKAIPRFFDSHGSFRKVAERAGLEARLKVRTRHELVDGAEAESAAIELATPVLVDSTYFTYKASFRAGSTASTRERDRGLAIAELYDVVRRIVSDESPERLSALELIVVGDKRLNQIVDELRGLGFLRNVWLKTAALKELEVWVNRLREETPERRTTEYEQAVNQVIRSTKATLHRNASEYVELGAVWIQLDKSIQDMLREAETNPQDEINPMRDFKLIRFALSDEILPGVKTIVNDLLNPQLSPQERRGHRSWHELLRKYSSAAGERAQQSDAELAAAVLWCFPSFNAIVRLLRSHVSPVGDRHSLGLMFAGACFDNHECIGEGRETLRELQKVHARLRSSDRRSSDELRAFIRLSVGLAYLNFHLWRIECQDWDWRRSDIGHAHLNPTVRNTLERAIDYATTTCEAMPDGPLDLEMRQLQKYAQNQRLFYLLELGDRARDSEIQDALQPMRQQVPGVWMSTFDDTLARYYHFKAVWTDNETSWSNYMDSALSKSEAANKRGRVDAVVRDFRDYLRDTHASGFSARVGARPDSKPPTRSA